MTSSLRISRVHSHALTTGVAAALYRLCDDAYGCATEPMFAELGPAEHLLGRSGDLLVSHLMWVTRWLQPDGRSPLRTAYIEMVATAPAAQRRGFATSLLEDLPRHLEDYELAALCPATEGLYARLGWRFWKGPLSARRDGGLVPTPEERVMILPLLRTPLLDAEAPLSVEWRPAEVW